MFYVQYVPSVTPTEFDDIHSANEEVPCRPSLSCLGFIFPFSAHGVVGTYYNCN